MKKKYLVTIEFCTIVEADPEDIANDRLDEVLEQVNQSIIDKVNNGEVCDNITSIDEDKGLYWSEIAAVTNEFIRQCDELGIEWTDEEVGLEAFGEMLEEYENGNLSPKLRLCGYGYREKERG